MRALLLATTLMVAGCPTCDSLFTGGWTASGEGFGMGGSTMTASLEFSQGGCSFTLTDWDMAMDMPSGGTLDGSAVTLTDDAGEPWRNCTGTIASETSMSGTCDGGDFLIEATPR
jgi:hypothetical protein